VRTTVRATEPTQIVWEMTNYHFTSFELANVQPVIDPAINQAIEERFTPLLEDAFSKYFNQQRSPSLPVAADDK
jgi:hypothetical protein